MSSRTIRPIAYIKTPFVEKFGIPRQSGMVESIISEIEFVPEFRSIDSVRGLEGFSHIWVLWEFSGFESEGWAPTVRPPRLGGNTRVGVFATRSPNRPNSIGMSCLKLVSINTDAQNAPLLNVAGADILNGTAIYDIKPYIPFSDSRPDASAGFSGDYVDYKLKVIFDDKISDKMNENAKNNIINILSLDPRPSYQNDPKRIYGITIFGYNIKFRVEDDVLTVTEAEML